MVFDVSHLSIDHVQNEKMMSEVFEIYRRHQKQNEAFENSRRGKNDESKSTQVTATGAKVIL